MRYKPDLLKKALSGLVCVGGVRRNSHFTNPHQRCLYRYVLRALRLLGKGASPQPLYKMIYYSHFTNPQQRRFHRYVLRALLLLAEGSQPVRAFLVRS